MRTRHSPGITRRAAERLLDGAAGSGPEHLTQVMSAATASARADELAGEQAAVAAFEASLPFEARPLSRSATPRKRKMPNLPLVNLLSMKVVAWSLAGLVAAGGAATAGTVAFSGSGSTSTGSVGGGLPAVTTGPGESRRAPPLPPDGTSALAGPAAAAGSPGAAPLSPVRLCTSLTSKVESVIGDARAATHPTPACRRSWPARLWARYSRRPRSAGCWQRSATRPRCLTTAACCLPTSRRRPRCPAPSPAPSSPWPRPGRALPAPTWPAC